MINTYNKSSYDSTSNYLNVRATKCAQTTRRSYSTLSSNKSNIDDLKIDPWFITGFTDGEGCFTCSVLKSSSYKLGWEIQLNFQIKLHVRDYPILLRIQHSLGGIGTVTSKQSTCVFRVRKIGELIELVKFFDKYPLISYKRGEYLLFKQILSIIQLKEHLMLQGIQKIINIRATLNFGLSKELQLMFPETVPVPRPLRETCIIPDTQWMAGFTSAEGNFSVSLDKGVFKSLLFKITQHKKDEVLLSAIREYFYCGYCYLRKNDNVMDFKVTKFSDINQIIIPFFIINPILGVKSLDFNDWCLASEIVTNREHKSEKGTLRILEIQKGMNMGRSR